MPCARARSGCSRGRAARRRRRRRGSAAPSALQSSPVALVAHVERLAGRIADRVVRPRRQLVVAAVLRPRCSRCRRPRPGSRSCGLAMTLIHGAGVVRAGPSGPSRIPVRPASKPPKPLKNSRPAVGARRAGAGRRDGRLRRSQQRLARGPRWRRRAEQLRELVGERSAPGDAARRARPRAADRAPRPLIRSARSAYTVPCGAGFAGGAARAAAAHGASRSRSAGPGRTTTRAR